MVFHYRILPEKKLIAERYAGTATLEGIIASIQELWADPLYKPEFDVLCDLVAMTSHASARDVPALLRFLRESAQTNRGRHAIVIRSPVLTALTMIYQAALPANQPFRIFSSMSSACEFLGLDAPPNLPE